VTEAIEPLRRDKVVRSSLEARVQISDAHLDLMPAAPAELAELFIVSAVEPNSSDAIDVAERSSSNAAAAGGICPRWRRTEVCARVVRRW
jgi:isoleucyl-tRNA synthetase